MRPTVPSVPVPVPASVSVAAPASTAAGRPGAGRRWRPLVAALLLSAAAVGAAGPGPSALAMPAPPAAGPACPQSGAPSDGPHDSWATAAPMPTARLESAATTGCDGTVYVLGGIAPTSQPGVVGDTDAAEAYGPGDGAWRALAPLPTSRAGLAAATVADGRILAIGGNASGACAEVEAYSPRSGGWEAFAPLPVPVAVARAATDAAGNVYVFDRATTEIYDAGLKAWRAGPAMPTPRIAAAVATGADGRIYVAGGYPADRAGAGPVDTVEVYTPATGRWSGAAPLPGPTGQGAGATARDGRIFVFGGYPDAGAVPGATTYVYTPATDGWAVAADLPQARTSLTAALGPDGRIYVIGGDPGDASAVPGPVDRVDVYTP